MHSIGLNEKIDAILEAMRKAYEAEGIEGDFDDARRHYSQDATNEEIDDDYDRWVVRGI
jgi:hypothetical protein